jgi:hypothetical protein
VYVSVEPGRCASVPLPKGRSSITLAVDLGAALVRLASGRPGSWKAWFPNQPGAGDDPFNFWLPWGATVALTWDSADGKDLVSVGVLSREQAILAGADTNPANQAYRSPVGVAVYV